MMGRLERLCRDFPKRRDLELIIVDSGSPPAAGEECRRICGRHRARYVYHHNDSKRCRPGAARNVGAQHTCAAAVTFFDLDYAGSANFWDLVLELMADEGLLNNKNAFLSIPLLRLDKANTDLYIKTGSAPALAEVANKPIIGVDDGIRPHSSMVVVERLHFLAVGGYRREFRGTGSEDAELFYRLIEEERILPEAGVFPRKKTGVLHHKNELSKFLLLAYPAFRRHLFVFHLWHPRATAHYYKPILWRNRIRYAKFARRLNHSGEHPPPLAGGGVKGKVLLPDAEPKRAMHCLRDVFPLLGSPLVAPAFGDEEEFRRFVKSEGVETVLLQSGRSEVYQRCRRLGLKTICFGKGVLPHSWFFDAKGFAPDYSPSVWDKPLSSEQSRKIAAYLRGLSHSDLARLKKLSGGFSGERLKRFAYFLRYRFYSFAVFRASSVKAKRRTYKPTEALPPLDFYELRLPGGKSVIYGGKRRSTPPPLAKLPSSRRRVVMEQLGKQLRTPPKRGILYRLGKDALIPAIYLFWELDLRVKRLFKKA